MQNWMTISEDYLSYLRNYEPHIPNSDYGTNHLKPFFGVLFSVGELSYVTQISHAKPRHEKLRNAPDFFKIFLKRNSSDTTDRLVAVVNLNYMFPVPTALLETLELRNIDQHRSFTSEYEKSKYIDLLNQELKEINKMRLESKAQKLYQMKYTYPDSFVSKRCLDFKQLEKYAASYNRI